MGIRFRKSINLGGGTRLNLSKKGAGLSTGVKGYRVSVGPTGVRKTASIPGTGISYTTTSNLNSASASNKKYHNSSNNESIYDTNASSILTSAIPREIKSKFYRMQSIAGYIGYFTLIAGFSRPVYFIPAAICLYARYFWRKNTDSTAIHYKKAHVKFKAKRYSECIVDIDSVLEHPNANPDLRLIKAECLKNIGNISDAINEYKLYFDIIDPNSVSGFDYHIHKFNAAKLMIENKDYDYAIKIAQSFPDTEIFGFDFNLWKNYMKGLCFIGKEQYDLAIEALKYAIGNKRSMDTPYIDIRYTLGVAYSKINKVANAKKEFQKVYAADPTYNNIGEIIETIESGEEINFNVSMEII